MLSYLVPANNVPKSTAYKAGESVRNGAVATARTATRAVVSTKNGVCQFLKGLTGK